MRRLLFALLLSALPAFGIAQSVVGDAEFSAVFSSVLMPLEAANDCPVFEIYLAVEPAQRSRGLMFVTSMPAAAGMLFIYPPNSRVSMWMKNTVISLDIVFLDATGKIINIAKETEPFSLKSVSAEAPAGFALELNAGAAERLGLGAGQQIIRTEWLTR